MLVNEAFSEPMTDISALNCMETDQMITYSLVLREATEFLFSDAQSWRPFRKCSTGLCI